MTCVPHKLDLMWASSKRHWILPTAFQTQKSTDILFPWVSHTEY